MFLVQSVGSIVVLNPMHWRYQYEEKQFFRISSLFFHRIKKVVHVWNDMNYCGLKFPFIQTTKKMDLSECVNATCCTVYVHFTYAKEAKWIHFWPFPFQKPSSLYSIFLTSIANERKPLCVGGTHIHTPTPPHTLVLIIIVYRGLLNTSAYGALPRVCKNLSNRTLN